MRLGKLLNSLRILHPDDSAPPPSISILSVRELRTLLAMTTTLPITMDDVHGLEDMLKSCDQNYTLPRPQVSPREYETLYDPKLVGHT